MTKKERERRVQFWSAVSAGCSAAVAGMGSQDSAVSFFDKWLAMLGPMVVVGVTGAVASHYVKNLFAEKSEPDQIASAEVRQIFGKSKKGREDLS